jgi:hypothetical protein
MRRSVSVDERSREQCDLVRQQKREIEAQAATHELQLTQLQARQREAVKELQRQHVRQLVDLWQAQGRTLGPWTAPVLEGELPKGFPSEKGGAL